MTQLRLGDLEPQRSDDHVTLNISNPENVGFGQAAADKTASTQNIVFPSVIFESDW